MQGGSTMQIVTPSDIEHVAWEGPLVPLVPTRGQPTLYSRAPGLRRQLPSQGRRLAQFSKPRWLSTVDVGAQISRTRSRLYGGKRSLDVVVGSNAWQHDFA
jgi:hypothetical protein